MNHRKEAYHAVSCSLSYKLYLQMLPWHEIKAEIEAEAWSKISEEILNKDLMRQRETQRSLQMAGAAEEKDLASQL